MAGFSFCCPRCGQPVAPPTGSPAGQSFACPHCGQTLLLRPPQRSRGVSPAGRPNPASARLPSGWIALDSPPGEQPAADRPAGRDLSFLDDGGALRRLQKPRTRRLTAIRNWLVPGSIAAALALVGFLFAWDWSANRGQRPAEEGSTAAATHPGTPSGDARAAANREIARADSNARERRLNGAAAGHEPIALLLVPAGARILVHLRPAKLWRPHGPGAEVRRCLQPLADWTEKELADRCLYPAEQIAECLFSCVLRSPGEAPDVAVTVRLARPIAIEEIAKRFGGERLEKSGLPVYVNGERALVVRDGGTFAVGPQSAAQEMASAAETPNPTDEAIEELVKRTDRSRDFTLVARPDDLDRFREALVPPFLADAVHRLAQWLDPDSAEGVAIGVRLADPLRIQLDMRTRPATPGLMLEEKVRRRLDQLGADVLAHVEQTRPATAGHRKLIGRVPAMLKAVSLGTQSGTKARLVSFDAVLPERAAPNLALGAFLVLAEKRPSGSTAEPKHNEAPGVVQSLAKKIDVDFRRTPLSEAYAFIGEETGLTFELDGGGLKLAGYTKNMAQTFRMSGVPASDVLRALAKTYPQLTYLVDEAQRTVIVTTREAAKGKGQKPLPL